MSQELLVESYKEICVPCMRQFLQTSFTMFSLCKNITSCTLKALHFALWTFQSFFWHSLPASCSCEKYYSNWLNDNNGQWWKIMENYGKWQEMLGNIGNNRHWWAMVDNDGHWWAMMANDGQWWAMMERYHSSSPSGIQCRGWRDLPCTRCTPSSFFSLQPALSDIWTEQNYFTRRQFWEVFGHCWHEITKSNVQITS